MAGYSKRMLAIFDRLESVAYSQARHIFPISHYVKENLINHYGIPPQKITVVGTGLGVIKPFYGTKDYCNKKILYVAKGRLQDKGGELAMESFRRALELDPQLQLTIVGSEEANKYRENRNVTVLGFVSLQELQELFDSHSLFLMPALNEPWGLVYLEAMACKMPIMGLNRNGFPELSGDGKYGFAIQELDPDVLCHALVNAFRSPERLCEMGEHAQRNCLREYSWENTVTRMLAAIEGDTSSCVNS
jgi:glycosyltransferase involved in cell wall biosynthesis